MSQLTLLVLQLGFLALLWFFIFAIVFALRSDLFGSRVRRISAPAEAPSAAPVAASAPAAAADTTPATQDVARRLVITSGAKAGAEVPLTVDELTIGRSTDSSLILRDDYTSTHHARLMVWNGQWMLQDLDSTNGTFMAGNRVTSPVPVTLNTPMKVGATTFELRR
ncbi:MAG: FHA domain-containing protein FhaB/FipA [Microbacteriaceae bacterium]